MRRVCGVERPERHLEPPLIFVYVSARFGVTFAYFSLTLILVGGELNNSSKIFGVGTYPQIFFKLDCRHFRPIVVLVWVLSWNLVKLGDISTSVLQTLVWALRS